MKRANVTGARSCKELSAYLPENYRVTAWNDVTKEGVIEGEDYAGWTLQGYVIPRLASGLISAREAD